MADPKEIRDNVVAILNKGNTGDPSFNIRQNRDELEKYFQSLGLSFEDSVGFTTEFIANGLISDQLTRIAKKTAKRLEGVPGRTIVQNTVNASPVTVRPQINVTSQVNVQGGSLTDGGNLMNSARNAMRGGQGSDDGGKDGEKKGFFSRFKKEQAEEAKGAADARKKAADAASAKQQQSQQAKMMGALAGIGSRIANRGGQSEGGGSGISIISILGDLVDVIPEFGDFGVLAINIIQILQALFGGYIGTAMLMMLVAAIDFGGGLLDFTGVTYFIDIAFPSVTINRYLLNRARAARAAKKADEAPDAEKTSLFTTPEGEPTTLAAFLFLIACAIPLYSAWKGSMAGIYISLAIFLLFFALKPFRDEFITVPGILFFVTMGLHIFYHSGLFGGPGLSFSTSVLIINLVIYVVITAIYAKANEHLFDNIRMGALVSIAAIIVYALPGVAVKYSGNEMLTTGLTVFALIAPVWPLFLLKELRADFPNGYSKRLLGAFTAVIMIIVIILVVSVIPKLEMVLPSFSTPQVDTREQATSFGGSLKERATQTLAKVESLFKQATDPGAYYTGQVEKNKKAPNGVTIERFRPQDKTVNNESEVIVHGVVNARSFLGTAVTVQPACLIDRKGAPEATVDPPITEVVYGTGQTFTCTFPPLKNGQYSVTGSVTFPFETWAYIQYTFVDEERARNIAMQQRDVNTELDIPEEPSATFTSGPVMVGMGGSTQPILVDTATPDSNYLQPGTKIGITVDPAWEGGKLQRVNSIELKVPRPFTIQRDKSGQYKCDRNMSQAPQQDLKDDQYTDYFFENPNQGPITMYTSLTCSLAIEDQDEATRLVTENDKAVRSFIAVVKYTYTIEEKASVQVK